MMLLHTAIVKKATSMQGLKAESPDLDNGAFGWEFIGCLESYYYYRFDWVDTLAFFSVILSFSMNILII